MDIRLADAERSRLRGHGPPPAEPHAVYRAEVLPALDEGRAIEEVARQHRMGVEAFASRRIKFLDEPDAGRPPRQDDEESDEV